MSDVKNPALNDEVFVGLLASKMMGGLYYSDGSKVPDGLYPQIALLNTALDLTEAGQPISFSYEDAVAVARKVFKLISAKDDDGQA